MTVEYETLSTAETIRLRRRVRFWRVWAVVATVLSAFLVFVADAWAPGGSLKTFIELEYLIHRDGPTLQPNWNQ